MQRRGSPGSTRVLLCRSSISLSSAERLMLPSVQVLTDTERSTVREASASSSAPSPPRRRHRQASSPETLAISTSISCRPPQCLVFALYWVLSAQGEKSFSESGKNDSFIDGSYKSNYKYGGDEHQAAGGYKAEGNEDDGGRVRLIPGVGGPDKGKERGEEG